MRHDYNGLTTCQRPNGSTEKKIVIVLLAMFCKGTRRKACKKSSWYIETKPLNLDLSRDCPPCVTSLSAMCNMLRMADNDGSLQLSANCHVSWQYLVKVAAAIESQYFLLMQQSLKPKRYCHLQPLNRYFT